MVQRDGSALTVSHQCPWYTRRSFARPSHHQAKVFVVVVETVDMPASPLRTAVASTVKLSYRDPPREQRPSHVAIDPTVGTESVHGDQHHACRAGGSKMLDVQLDAP